ncbi:MAG: flagellar basal body rod protein FlgB [Rhodospirillaceae bacterium]
MDMSKMALFRMANVSMDHSAQRQKVLAQNIANADTPGYNPSDLPTLKFRDIAEGLNNRVSITTTNAAHSTGTRPAPDTFRQREDRRPYESSPDGNAVVLEEQMDKLGRTRSGYNMALEIYRKHMNMMKMAVRGSGGR